MFYEINFPEIIAINSINSLCFDTSIVKSKNSREQCISSRDFPLLNFKIANTIKNKNEIDELIKFFRIVKGKGNGFRFKDYLDYKLSNQSIAIGNGETKKFQIKKTYIIETNISTRIIKKIVSNSLNVFINQINCNSLLKNINYNTGEIEFANPPNDNDLISVSCEFDVPVRFKNDILDINIANNNQYEINNVELVEIMI